MKEFKRVTLKECISSTAYFTDNESNLSFIFQFKRDPLSHNVLLATNVLSLQDICFRQLIASYEKLFPRRIVRDGEICEYFNLPTFLNRKYFGPSWMVNNANE